MSKKDIACLWVAMALFSISLILFISDWKDNNISFSGVALLAENALFVIGYFIDSIKDD